MCSGAERKWGEWEDKRERELGLICKMRLFLKMLVMNEVLWFLSLKVHYWNIEKLLDF